MYFWLNVINYTKFPIGKEGLENEHDEIRRSNNTDPRVNELTVEVNWLLF